MDMVRARVRSALGSIICFTAGVEIFIGHSSWPRFFASAFCSDQTPACVRARELMFLGHAKQTNVEVPTMGLGLNAFTVCL